MEVFPELGNRNEKVYKNKIKLVLESQKSFLILFGTNFPVAQWHVQEGDKQSDF